MVYKRKLKEKKNQKINKKIEEEEDEDVPQEVECSHKKTKKTKNKKERSDHVECIAIEYCVLNPNDPNYSLNNRIDRVEIKEILGFGESFHKDAVINSVFLIKVLLKILKKNFLS